MSWRTAFVGLTDREPARFTDAMGGNARQQSRAAAGSNPTAMLRETCIHEYAHLVAARSLGACGYVRIARVRSPPAPDRWHGECHLYGDLGDADRRLVALAGSVAERVARDGCRDVAALLAWLSEPLRLSRADAIVAQGFDAEDVRRCLAIVVAGWRDIETEADERVAALSSTAAT
jgi:hypothetical protein